MPNPLGTFQTAFLSARKRDLIRIAKSTQGEQTAEDLEQEAWIIATRIGDKRGKAIDFANLADQNTILAWLYQEHVAYADKRIRHAVKLDCPAPGGDGETIGDRLGDARQVPRRRIL